MKEQCCVKREVEDLCVSAHIYAYNLHVLEQRIGFAKRIQVKASLVEYKYENKLVL